MDRAKRHSLYDILVITICGVICGADNGIEIELFGRSKRRWLQTFLKLPNGIPSHDTFGRVFGGATIIPSAPSRISLASGTA